MLHITFGPTIKIDPKRMFSMDTNIYTLKQTC